MARALEAMYQTLARMPEHCDPHVYYRRVRPYIHGWKNNPALPNGLIYEGVFAGTPQQLAGETGAQSTIIPALDAALGVSHRDDPLRPYLLDVRNYMPPLCPGALLHAAPARSPPRLCLRGLRCRRERG